MNRVLIYMVFVVSVVLLSCKNDTKSTENTNTTDKKINTNVSNNEEIFSLTLNAIYPKDDVVIVFYTQYEGETYGEDQMIRKKVTGSENVQEIEFKMKKKDYPLNLRIDFSAYETQDTIKVYDCVLKYQNKSYIIEGNKLKDYFIFNDGIEILNDSISFKLKPFMLNNKPVFDPYIKGNSKLEETLMTKI
ncbi:MAG: hypothetical protein KDD05_08510 [Psychroserpens sp.]|nr:hypothetical protein [Psychroserpens sp.]